MSPVFWLILVVGSSGALHVGNFSSLVACQQAGLASMYYGQPNGTFPGGWLIGKINFICVQSQRYDFAATRSLKLGHYPPPPVVAVPRHL
jgi:hypothetical protein